jgi:hypothetical protein
MPARWSQGGRRGTYISDEPLRGLAASSRRREQSGDPFVDAFLTAPPRGLSRPRSATKYYDSQDAYLEALGRALQVEYETIVSNGFLLQIDAPDLGLERHITYAQQPLSNFLDFAERVVATINNALRQRPTPSGAPACLLGQLRRSPRCDAAEGHLAFPA